MVFLDKKAKEYIFKTIKNTDILCFDIEVSSFWEKDGKIYGYNKRFTDSFYNNATACCVSYIQQFSINENVYYTRELKDMCDFFIELSENFKQKFTIWVHSLSYEFGFLVNYIKFDNVFARQTRHPIKVEYKNLSFRCSYMLTRLSLSTWGESLGIEKLDTLDYDSKIRSPFTKLTQKELDYCERDCIVLYNGIKKFLKKYETFKKIPLTQTGEVRLVIKDCARKEKGYTNLCTKLLPKDVNEYKRLKKCFAGGDTHANIKYVGKIIENVGSFDESSGYPGMLFRKKFPMSKWIKCDYEIEKNRFDFDKKAYIFECVFYNIHATSLHHYISRSRMVSIKNGVYDNGRLVYADMVVACITELDYQIICDFYKWEKFECISLYKSLKDYIPNCIINPMLDFFYYKTTLKDSDNETDLELYMASKQQLNSMFGMCVTDIVNMIIEFVNNEWVEHDITDNDIQKELNERHEKKYKNFLSYAWGVWTTAYNRFELWHMIKKISEKEDNIMYYDTDSIKLENAKKYAYLFEERNNEIILENEKVTKDRGLKEDCFYAYTKKGTKKILGIWENEGNDDFICYDRFITLGAKKYAFEKNGKIGITVAGVPKKGSMCLKKLEDFKDGFVFDKDICGKKLLTYISDCPKITLKDGYTIKESYGINMRNTAYTIGITDEFIEIISQLKKKGWKV